MWVAATVSPVVHVLLIDENTLKVDVCSGTSAPEAPQRRRAATACSAHRSRLCFSALAVAAGLRGRLTELNSRAGLQPFPGSNNTRQRAELTRRRSRKEAGRRAFEAQIWQGR